MIRDWYLMLFAAAIVASACTTPDEAERSLDTAQLHETPAQYRATNTVSTPSHDSAPLVVTLARLFR